MYKIYEKDEAIKEIQTYIHFLSDRNGDLPLIFIDGIYGSETAYAVKSFQEMYGINADGIVDFITFEKLYSEFLKSEIKSQMRGYVVSSDGFPIKYGDYGNDASVVNAILDEISSSYSEIEIEGDRSYFGKSTENSVRYIQSVFRIEENGIVDELTYERMLNELEAIRFIGSNYD